MSRVSIFAALESPNSSAELVAASRDFAKNWDDILSLRDPALITLRCEEEIRKICALAVDVLTKTPLPIAPHKIIFQIGKINKTKAKKFFQLFKKEFSHVPIKLLPETVEIRVETPDYGNVLKFIHHYPKDPARDRWAFTAWREI